MGRGRGRQTRLGHTLRCPRDHTVGGAEIMPCARTPSSPARCHIPVSGRRPGHPVSQGEDHNRTSRRNDPEGREQAAPHQKACGRRCVARNQSKNDTSHETLPQEHTSSKMLTCPRKNITQQKVNLGLKVAVAHRSGIGVLVGQQKARQLCLCSCAKKRGNTFRSRGRHLAPSRTASAWWISSKVLDRAGAERPGRANLFVPGSDATAYGKMTIGQPISTVRHSSSISLLAKAMQPSVQSCCNVRFKPFG